MDPNIVSTDRAPEDQRVTLEEHTPYLLEQGRLCLEGMLKTRAMAGWFNFGTMADGEEIVVVIQISTKKEVETKFGPLLNETSGQSENKPV